MSQLDQRGLPIGYEFRPEWEITPRQTKAMLADPATGVILLDCRRPEEWAAGRIPGAIHIPMDQIEKRADELEDDEGGKTHPIAVYCHTGRRSLRVASTLRALGYSKAASVAGGIDLWSVDIDPSIPRY
jgi:rhodanese-related sulfurtransferase